MGRRLNPDSAHWKKLRARVIARDKHCFVCETTNNLTPHHIKPRSRGGKTNERNLITMCGPCHDRVELEDMDWPAIINFRKQTLWRLKYDFDDADNEPRKVGKDKFGVFVIRGVQQNCEVIYNGAWPIPAPKVKEAPIYVSLPV